MKEEIKRIKIFVKKQNNIFRKLSTNEEIELDENFPIKLLYDNNSIKLVIIIDLDKSQIIILLKKNEEPYRCHLNLLEEKYSYHLLSLLKKIKFKESEYYFIEVYNKIQGFIIDSFLESGWLGSSPDNDRKTRFELFLLYKDLNPKSINERIHLYMINEDNYIDSLINGLKAKKRKEFFTMVKEEFNYIYILFNHDTKLYKIGFSKETEHREATLQSKEPNIKLLHKWIASKKIETQLHKIFKDKRVRGEWFNLEESDINEIIDFMKPYKHDIGEHAVDYIKYLLNSINTRKM